MHEKTFIADGKIVLTGSANMTHNAMENNKEALYRFSDIPQAIGAMLEDFELQWSESEEVSDEQLEQALSNVESTKEKRRARSSSRSMSRDLQTVNE